MGNLFQAVHHIDWEKCRGKVPIVMQNVGREVIDLRFASRDLFEGLQDAPADDKPVWWRHLEMSEVLIECDRDSLLCRVPKCALLESMSCFFPFMLQEIHRVVDWDKFSGLIPVATQRALGSRVLMQAWMNREALQRTVETGHMWYWSRSRQCLWEKGSTSGAYQYLEVFPQVYGHCEHESLLFQARQRGDAACHEGYKSCFSRQIMFDGSLKVVGERVFDPR